MILPSMKFSQCQTVFRFSLRSSPNDEIKSLWKSTSSGMSIQYDVYKNTKDVLKAVRSEHKHRLQTQLQSQGAILSFVLDHSLTVTKSIWTSVQSKMPKNIFNFTIRYLNNSLSTRSNLTKWNFAQSSECSFCHLPETLLHVVAGCKSYLEEFRYTWRHNSALHILANYFRASVNGMQNITLLHGFTPVSYRTGVVPASCKRGLSRYHLPSFCNTVCQHLAADAVLCKPLVSFLFSYQQLSVHLSSN